VGGCTAESAAAVCNPGDELGLDVGAALTTLLDNHLLLREERISDALGRFLSEQTEARIRAQLPAAEFAAAWEHGTAMDLASAMAAVYAWREGIMSRSASEKPGAI
jgi:hypothetical protein